MEDADDGASQSSPRNNDDDVKREFGISSSEDEGMVCDDEEKNASVGGTGKVTIKLSPKAKKVGAPSKMKKNVLAGENPPESGMKRRKKAEKSRRSYPGGAV